MGGGVLVVNHQHRLPPNERERVVYRRQEFIDVLLTSVISARPLFDWWRTSDWAAVHQAVLGHMPDTARLDPPATPLGPPVGKIRVLARGAAAFALEETRRREVESGRSSPASALGSPPIYNGLGVLLQGIR